MTLKLEVGKYYKTRGGWKAKVIHKINRTEEGNFIFVVIQRIGTDKEFSTHHSENGESPTLQNSFDIISEWPEEDRIPDAKETINKLSHCPHDGKDRCGFACCGSDCCFICNLCNEFDAGDPVTLENHKKACGGDKPVNQVVSAWRLPEDKHLKKTAEDVFENGFAKPKKTITMWRPIYKEHLMRDSIDQYSYGKWNSDKFYFSQCKTKIVGWESKEVQVDG